MDVGRDDPFAGRRIEEAIDRESEAHVTDSDRVVREARAFGGYVLGAAPSAEVITAYGDPRSKARVGEPADRFDSFLVRWALLGSFSARAADLYARILRPNALLRRKLILILALAEVHGRDADTFRTPESSGPLSFFAGAGIRGVVSALSLALLLPLLGLSHLALRQWGQPR